MYGRSLTLGDGAETLMHPKGFRGSKLQCVWRTPRNTLRLVLLSTGGGGGGGGVARLVVTSRGREAVHGRLYYISAY